jgi:hypothetical protein
MENRWLSYLKNIKIETKIEIGISTVLIGFCCTVLYGMSSANWSQFGEKLATAGIVVVIVRWLQLIFQETSKKEDIYASTLQAYRNAIERATRRIWIYQTWLPADSDPKIIAKSAAQDVRIVLASFRCTEIFDKNSSYIFARIAGREIPIPEAQGKVAGSVRPILDKLNLKAIRFNAGHHPGWIAVIDEEVYWGHTPITETSHQEDAYFNCAKIRDAKGEYWKDQFLDIWINRTHPFDEELKYNPSLRPLCAKQT